MLSANVDELLVPTMMSSNVGDALRKLNSLCNELKETDALGKRLQTRLLFLHGYPHKLEDLSAPVMYADAVGSAVRFAKKYSTKAPLLRIAANRIMLRELREIHSKIDALFTEMKLDTEPEMTAWKENWDADLAAQAQRFYNGLAGLQPANETDKTALEEAFATLQYEAERQRNDNTDEHLALINAALELQPFPSTSRLPEFFISRDDVETYGDSFEHGFIGQVCKAKWGAPKQQVAVKHFVLDTNTVQAALIAQATVARQIDHQHVLKFYGACHVGKPVFTVCEFAPHGNFATYFANQTHQSKFWQRVREAVEGLSHLHDHGILHGDIRCNNLLVGADETARISDAGYNNIRRLSVGRSLNGPPNSTRWAAPECLLEQGAKAEPTVASDVYSFGMTIIEAKTGARPWPKVESDDDDDIIEIHCDETVYERPQEHFTEQEWEIVQGLCQFQAGDRISLARAIEMIDELPKRCCEKARLAILESGGEPTKFCGDCGQRFEAPSAPASL